MNSRRSFLASLGAFSAATVAPEQLWARAPRDCTQFEAPPRGLALAPDDFAFAPGLVYLQTGSLGPSPRPVIERTIAMWRELELDPAHYAYGVHEQAMDVVRAKAAAFIGCDTDELVLTKNTTDGINSVAQGLTLAAGDRVLTTDQEHPGGRVGWDYVARRFGVVIDVVPIAATEHDANAIVDRFAKAITPRTRVLSFSHLLSSTGLRMPVAELSALATSRGCLSVVDGAQAVGGIVVNVKALGCDVYATSGHKWLLAPKGTGLLYLTKRMGTAVAPIALESGRAAYSASSGVTSLPSVLGMEAAFDYMNAIGVQRVEAHNLALRDRLFVALQQVPTLRVVSPASGPMTSPLLTFALPARVESGAFRQKMHKTHRIQLKGVPSQWLNGIRVSTHLFNTERDVDALVSALHTELV